jgi:hypothetical protein
MSDIKDLRTTHQVPIESETSFVGNDDGFHLIKRADVPPADDRDREEIQQHSDSSADALSVRAKQPAAGFIARIGRGVKSAVGGAIGGAINVMFASG